jgi:hypothetical protein
MRRSIYVWVILTGVTLLYSCDRSVSSSGKTEVVAENRIFQQPDGDISLKIDKAECYHDMTDPSSNTAEWSVVVSKSGRYNVWLSSATKDTTDLNYKKSVLVSVRDNTLETLPVCDRVVRNSGDVTGAYYHADSFMGSLFILDTGLYNIQVISDKIIPENYKADGSSADDETKLLSLLLTPARR